MIRKKEEKQMSDAYFREKAACCMSEDKIDRNLFDEFGVKRGLRDFNGKGVLTGLTNISMIESSKTVDGKSVPCDGKLWFRGYEINDLVNGIGERGFEEVAYLLLMGELPDKKELDLFCQELNEHRRLPQNFTRDVIMKAPGQDIMNSMTKSVLTLASYDDKVSDNSVENVLRQSMNLISVFPMLAVYGYHAYNHYDLDGSMYIHRPDPNRSTAENILYMLRPDQKYTDLEARVLDTALILHMEHGGGNNSTFTTRVVTSSGSDTYSVIAAALSSLKGPKHGGANIKVVRMMNFGVFVELLPGKDGMVHISKLAKGRVEKCEDVVKIGDELEVKVAEIDSQGRINLVRNDIEYDNAEMPRRSAPGQRPPRRDANRR